MLRIVTGPFHPTLEQALVEEVRSLKSGDPFHPLAVVVPSAQLASRIKQVLALDCRLSLLNLHVLTIHQFALRVWDDLVAGGEPLPGMQLVDDFYFEQLVRHVVKRQLPGLEILSRLPASPGTWRGLWATLRDLKDAAVVPTTALKAVDEGLFEEGERSWLQTLFTLHVAVLEGSRSLGVGSPDDLLSSLGSDLSRSPFFNRLARICLYGFYDLLQVQLSFLEAVTRCVRATLYVPLESSAPYAFARRFFERYLLPLAASYDDRSGGRSDSSLTERVLLTVTNVIGVREELAVVCREILTLVEVHGYRFDEIGVVARSLDPYRGGLQSVFDRYLVPFTSTAGQPLSREPLAKQLLRLASLPVNDFDPQALLDIVSSPCYRMAQRGAPTVEPRSDMWRIAVAELGIAKGKEDWRRLSTSLVDGVTIGICDRTQLYLLAHVAMGIIADCEGLPKRGTGHRLTEAFLALVEKHLAIPGWTEEDAQVAEEQNRAVLIGLLLKRAVERLMELDPLEAELSWEEWTDLFRLAIEETMVPIEGDPHGGVQVLDAMEARGLRFRALFVMGLNEQAFPRSIREDAFLRDRQRLVLESTLGFGIDEKLAGHDEERLLFELLCRAATHRLYLSYLRTDEDGRVMVVSPLVNAAQRDSRFTASAEATIPRRLTERVASQPAVQDLLPAQDLALSFLLREQKPGPILDQTGQDRRLCEEGLAVQIVKERDSLELGPFDGLLGPPEAPLPLFERQSLSPTSIQRYATCPFQYFAEKLLHLRPMRPRQNDGLPALIYGTLIHDALRLGYERLTAARWPEATIEPDALERIIATAAQDVCTAHASTHGTGHALLWTLAQEEIVELVKAVVVADEEDFRAGGYRPHSFEIDAEGLVALGATQLSVHGKLDRIDVRADPPGLRIVDYKFKQGSEMSPQDRNLVLSAVRGFKLQPPLYGSMTVPRLPAPSEVQFIFLAPRWESPIVRSSFDVSTMAEKTGEAIKHTIGMLVQGIERREFFILPNGYCDHCEFPSICRLHDQTTWWRSYRSPQAKILRRLRTQKVGDE